MEGIEIRKHWDSINGRMTLLLRNGPEAVSCLTVEDTYPESITGILCFARSAGAIPTASAARGKITWRLTGLKPGEVRELVYTALSPEALRNPAVKKCPGDRDFALLESMKDVSLKLSLEDLTTDPISKIPPAKSRIEMPEAKPEIVEGHKTGRCTVISVGAGKGGTGKTTFSINLGIALAEAGHDTVLMDADVSMSNLASYAGIEVSGLQATLHDVMAGEAEPEKAVYRAFHDRLRIVPSGMSIGGFLKMDRNLLGDIIDHFSRGADYIVIDTPAGYNKEVALSLKASDFLVLVLNPDEGSMIDGLKVQEMAHILEVRVPGIVLNRYDMKGHRYSKSQIEEYFGTPVIAMIPEDENLRRKDKVPLMIADPDSRAAQEIHKVVETVTGRKRSMPQTKPFSVRLMEALFK